jgi:hypothetical protein
MNDLSVTVVTSMRCGPTDLDAFQRRVTVQVCLSGSGQATGGRFTLSTSRVKDVGKSERPAAVVAVALMATAVPLTTALDAGDTMVTVGFTLATVSVTGALVAVTARVVVTTA